MVRCAIWYHLYNLKNVKNIHGGVLILVNFTEINAPPWVFFYIFKIVQNGTKLNNAPHTVRIWLERSESCFIQSYLFQMIGEKTLSSKDFTSSFRDIFI